jgi:hypothetical protein
VIVLIGDVHGKTGTYQKMIRRMPPGQRTIQLGDMGIGFPYAGLHKMPDEHKWFRGNHDNPEKCRLNYNYLGDFGYLPEDRLFWLAGAFSIDRAWRVQGETFWIDEELSFEELGKAVHLYNQVKPEFVISHEAPARAGRALLDDLMGPYFSAKQECCNSRTSQALQIMLEAHQPKEWVFGHYHVNKTFQVSQIETKFTCVAELSTYELNTDATDQQRTSIILPSNQ